MARTVSRGIFFDTKLRFVPQRKLAAQVALNPEMGTMLKGLAESAAKHASEVGPVGDSDPGEHYVDQIEGIAEITSKRGGWIGRINAWKFTSAWIELGTSKMPAFAPLRRGAELAGLVFVARRRRR